MAEPTLSTESPCIEPSHHCAPKHANPCAEAGTRHRDQGPINRCMLVKAGAVGNRPGEQEWCRLRSQDARGNGGCSCLLRANR
jgi:hypothetical protein